MHFIFPLDNQIDWTKGRTISAPGTASYDYLNQAPGAENVGGVTLHLEPLPERHIEFVEEISNVRGFDAGTNDVCYYYVRGVIRAIRESCSEGVNGSGPIVAVRFTLRELLIHPVDSREFAFYLATTYALRNFLKPEALAALEPLPQIARR